MGLSSITVKWDPVPQGSRNGLLIGYQVKYRQIFSNRSDGEVKSLFKMRHTATLTELEKDTVYSIEVAGVTQAGTGVYSEPVTAQTCKFKTY